MRKWMIMLATALMLLTLAACSLHVGDNYEDGPPESQQPSDVQPEEPDVPAEPEVPAEPPDTLLPDPDKWEGDIIVDMGEDSGVPAAEITASHTDVSLKAEGETFRLSPQGVTGIYACSYTSADPSVAAVDELTGEVTAAAPGTTTVTMHVECEAGQFDLECIVRCRWEAPEPSLPSSGEPELPSGTAQPSLSEFFSSLQGSYEGLGAMMVMDGELLDNYYPGLGEIAAVEEVLIQETMISIANVAVGLVKLSDDATPDDVAAVQNIFQSRINTQANGGAWYPESCETWENGVITSTSNVIGMFVCPDSAQAMADLFTATFTN